MVKIFLVLTLPCYVLVNLYALDFQLVRVKELFYVKNVVLDGDFQHLQGVVALISDSIVSPPISLCLLIMSLWINVIESRKRVTCLVLLFGVGKALSCSALR